MDQFDVLYSISDLHIGGEPAKEGQPSAQMFTQQEALGAFFRWIATRDESKDKRVGLVLNGDIVDFLARPTGSPQSKYMLSEEEAVALIEKIFEWNKDVWDGLEHFLNVGHKVILGIGNHDLELVMPRVQEAIWGRLCKDPATRRRMRFYDLEAYRARVGGEEILFIHGNQQDGWNTVDLAALRAVRDAIERNLPLKAWEPNRGTKLVIDQMNKMKQHHAFVDMMPNDKLAVEMGLWLELAGWGDVFSGFISGAQAWWNPQARSAPWLQGTGTGPARQRTDGRTLLRQADMQFHAKGAEDLSADGDLGALSWIGGWKFDRAMTAAYYDIAPSKPEGTDAAICARVKSSPALVVAGHTHLRRFYPAPQGFLYANTGTWADMIDLRQAPDAATLRRALTPGPKNQIPSYLLFKPRTFLEIRDGRATLCNFEPVLQSPAHAERLDGARL